MIQILLPFLHRKKNHMKFLKEEEYAALGFQCGMEIHQQLFTHEKLFCNCPAGLYSNKYNAEVLRHMRPTLSELGEYDGTALMEFKTKKEIVYRLHKESVCTYEMDDTPPFLVNQKAIDIAIEIALMLNSSIVDEMHIARKQYLDGSIPTGFQRTAIIGVGGWIPYKDRKIRIIQLSCEEDSCREVSDVGHTITFKTDRLGMPLIEAVTYPDMKTPWEAAEVVERIGRIFRVTEKVRRGMGSVRQDVNVSIKGGTRIEIKGVPRIGNIPALVHIEALRQKALLEIKDEFQKRGIHKENLEYEERDVTGILKHSKLEQFKKAIKNGHHIRGIKLCGMADILNHPTQPDINFDRELAGRVRVIACLDEPPYIFHTDNYRLYDGYRKDLRKLRKVFKAGSQDVIVLVWGPKEDTITGTQEIRLRILDAMDGIPSETRQPFPDGTTDFERILPGPDRMYPDTDLPPTKIDDERLDRIKSTMNDYPWSREERYLKYGVPKETAYRLAISPRAMLFDRIEKELKVDMKLVGITLMQTLKSLKRAGFNGKALPDERIFRIFQLLEAGKFYREAIPYILKLATHHSEDTIEEILEKKDIRIYSKEERDKVIEEKLQVKPSFMPKRDKKLKLTRFYAGLVMRKLWGRVCAEETLKVIEKRLKAE